MILSGKIGKWTVDFLTQFRLFNSRYKVVRFGNTYKILQSKPIDELKQTEITTSNILSLKFDIYDAFAVLKEHVAQVKDLDDVNNQLLINVWDSEQMNEFIKSFSLPLTAQTYSELKVLLSKKVFNEKFGSDYNFFISVWLQPDIKKVSDNDRRFSEGTLKYSLRHDADQKEKRLKSKFSLTKQEARAFCSNISYWADK